MDVEIKITREDVMDIIKQWAQKRMPGFQATAVGLDAWSKTTIYMTDGPLPVSVDVAKESGDAE